jgi:hypothetical protein
MVAVLRSPVVASRRIVQHHNADDSCPQMTVQLFTHMSSLDSCSHCEPGQSLSKIVQRSRARKCSFIVFVCTHEPFFSLALLPRPLKGEPPRMYALRWHFNSYLFHFRGSFF